MADRYDSLDGQVALVSGANRGLGAAIAADLAGLGATVYAGRRDPSRAVPDGTRAVRLDVTDEEEIETAVLRVVDEAGRLDVLVNNAGVYDDAGPLHRAPTEELDRVMATNLRGATLLTKHALAHLLTRDGARVVNLSSGMGALGEPQSGGAPAYRLSKTGINGLTAYLHGEYGDRGLLANAVCPGWTATDMGGERAPRTVAEGADTPVWLCRFRPGSPAGRLWRDREVIEW